MIPLKYGWRFNQFPGYYQKRLYMNIDFSVVFDSIVELLQNFLASLPQVILGLIILGVSFFIAQGVKNATKHGIERAGLSSQAATAVGRLAQWAAVLLAILIAMTIIFPSVDPATLLSTLGVGGVAIGFAFRDILQNFFAGLILLLTEPFRIGDQIEVGEFAGTVKRIETRATTLHTYDGRDVIIPNSELFVDSVIVNTAHKVRRSQYDVGIGYGDGIDEAKELILAAMTEAKGVLAEPEPQAFVVDLADFTVNIRARWWTDSHRSDVIKTQDRVLSAIAHKLTKAGIDLPFPTYQLLFHDQTEATDGDRRQQREGWPVPQNGRIPQPRYFHENTGEHQNNHNNA
jgi:small-conductance mechanosensitive channel